MSAIFGIYNYDSKPVDSAQIAKMAEILSHRGKDGVGVWTNSAVGLGHRMLWTTPESLHEKLPKTYFSNLTITADARLDNQDELIEELGIKQTSDEVITDSDLILSAYQKWGEECPEKLLGDFAFAIWDENKRNLFCARDHFGIKPFYYFASSKLFTFATEAKALFTLKEVSREINEDMIANYLVGNFENKETTLYQNIFRLPPGHNLIINQDKVDLRCYYKLNPDCELRLGSDEEYAEGLREIFTEAVHCRMRSAMPIGSMLSGGLDSTSISCVAGNLFKEKSNEPFPTLSIVYNRIKECDEQEYINSTLDQGDFKSHFIPGDEHDALSTLSEIYQNIDFPLTGPGFPTTWQLYKRAKSEGLRTIFDGHDGDNAVSHGHKHLDELAQAGQWIKLAIETKDLASFHDLSHWKMMSIYIRQYRWRPFLAKHPKVREVGKRLQRKLSTRNSSKSHVKANFENRSALFNKRFVEEQDFDGKLKILRQASPDDCSTAREQQFRSLTTGGQVLALEECDAVSAAFGINTSYPFWDKRLIEYCLSLPAEQKYSRGWNRVVMRRAMKNIIPSKVCWRKEKTDFFANVSDGLVKKGNRQLKQILLDENNPIQKFFDKNALNEIYQKVCSRKEIDDSKIRVELNAIFDIASFSFWLEHLPNSN